MMSLMALSAGALAIVLGLGLTARRLSRACRALASDLERAGPTESIAAAIRDCGLAGASQTASPGEELSALLGAVALTVAAGFAFIPWDPSSALGQAVRLAVYGGAGVTAGGAALALQGAVAEHFRRRARRLLDRSGPRGEAVQEALRGQAVKDAKRLQAVVRRSAAPSELAAAAAALRDLGPAGLGAIAELGSAQDPGIRGRAVTVMRAMATADVVPALVTMVSDEAPDVRKAAIGALAALSIHWTNLDPAELVAPALVLALIDSRGDVRDSALEALRKAPAGSHVRRLAVPLMVSLLAAEHGRLKPRLIRAIVAMLDETDPGACTARTGDRIELAPALAKSLGRLNSLNARELANVLNYLQAELARTGVVAPGGTTGAVRTSRKPSAAGALTDASATTLIDRLAGLLPALHAGLPLVDEDWPDDPQTWDRSHDLRQASRLAERRDTSADGLARLETLAAESPMSAAPVVLRAQALAAGGRPEEAVVLLLSALEHVAARSEVFDMLRSVAQQRGALAEAAAWAVLAAQAMPASSRSWGPFVFLAGAYTACGMPDAASDCREVATCMRGGAPVSLDAELCRALDRLTAGDRRVGGLLKEAWESSLRLGVKKWLAS